MINKGDNFSVEFAPGLQGFYMKIFEILIFYDSPQQRSVKARFSDVTLNRKSAGQFFANFWA